jgi:hypothetical protein
MPSKAHTTVVNRLLRRYQGQPHAVPPLDIQAGDLVIAVETSATLSESVPQLLALQGQRFIAVTNHESLQDALRLTADTPLGVMDAQGQIIKPVG